MDQRRYFGVSYKYQCDVHKKFLIFWGEICIITCLWMCMRYIYSKIFMSLYYSKNISYLINYVTIMKYQCPHVRTDLLVCPLTLNILNNPGDTALETKCRWENHFALHTNFDKCTILSQDAKLRLKMTIS